jgi:preprotein translocase SecE subunit
VASRISNRGRARPIRDEDDQTDAQAEEPEADLDAEPADEAEAPTDDSLSVAISEQSVAAAASVAAARRPFADNLPRWIPAYIRNAILELSKVTWPTSKETMNATTVVVIFSIIFAAIFFAVDYGLTTLLQAIVTKIHG